VHRGNASPGLTSLTAAASLAVVSALFRPGFYAVCSLTVIDRVLAQASLPKDSPFTPAAAAPIVNAAAEPYEFAAVNTIGQKTSVYIFDKQVKKGRWILIGETVNGIVAKSYDATREAVAVRIGGQDKVLTLRRPGNGPVSGGPAAAPNPAWNIPPTIGPVMAEPVVLAPAPAAVAVVTPAPTVPASPAVIAKQEQEARMLVSDLLEIGMAQRKAYEEAQKKAATPTPAAPAAPVEATKTAAN
jgi:hypothetical protein